MKFALPILSVLLVSCASQSAKTVANLDKARPAFHSEKCATAVETADRQEDIKLSRTIASPLLVVLSGGLLAVPVVAANVGLDVADNVNASDISVACGGEGKSTKEIVVNVGRGAAMGLTTGGLNSSGISTPSK
jgi:hypothetical protein